MRPYTCKKGNNQRNWNTNRRPKAAAQRWKWEKVGFSGRQIMFSTLRTAQRQKQTTNERQVGDTVKEIFGPNSSADRKRSGRQLGDKWQNKVCGPERTKSQEQTWEANCETRGNKWMARSYHPNDAPTNPTINCFWNRAAWHIGRQVGDKRK